MSLNDEALMKTNDEALMSSMMNKCQNEIGELIGVFVLAHGNHLVNTENTRYSIGPAPFPNCNSACFVCNLVYERREQHFVSTVSNMFQTYPLQELNRREQAHDLADGL
jgi:hypothetical protein